MLFRRCRSVHTFRMERPISVAFLDAALRVVRVRRCRPRRLLVLIVGGGARHVLECDAGATVNVGDRSGSDAEHRVNRDRADRGDRHQGQGDGDGRPPRHGDRLTARAVGFEQAEPFEHGPELVMRHTCGRVQATAP